MSRFKSEVVVDNNGVPLAGAVGQIYSINDTTNSFPLPIFAASGAAFPLDQLVANDDGVTPQFNTPNNPLVKWVSGSYVIDMVAWDLIPTGGEANQVLTKVSPDDYDSEWADPKTIPSGGVDGQVLTKDGELPYQVRWQNPTGGSGGGGGTPTEFMVAYARQDLVTGSWPLRPTDSENVLVLWVGRDNWPAVVATGVNGPRVGDILYEIKVVS